MDPPDLAADWLIESCCVGMTTIPSSPGRKNMLPKGVVWGGEEGRTEKEGCRERESRPEHLSSKGVVTTVTFVLSLYLADLMHLII